MVSSSYLERNLTRGRFVATIASLALSSHSLYGGLYRYSELQQHAYLVPDKADGCSVVFLAGLSLVWLVAAILSRSLCWVFWPVLCNAGKWIVCILTIAGKQHQN